MIRDASADRRRAEHGRARLRASIAIRTRSNQINPHLHNVPLQIAAERGLPALAVWLWFVVVAACAICARRSATAASALLAAAALAAIGRDARRRPVRVQLRRLRVPDAVPAARHAAVRGGAPGCRRRARMTLPPLDARRARDLVARLRGRRVLVVGDVMLDRFIVGRVTRISPEAPVPVVRSSHEYVRLGGAANVAHNLAALGAQRRRSSASSAATRPRDGCATQLAAAGIAPTAWSSDRGRPTTRRSASSPSATSRWRASTTRATRDVARRGRAALVERDRRARRATPTALLVSDYLKGAVTQARDGARCVACKRGAACRCSSTRRFRISTATPAPRWSRPTTTKPKPPRTCASAPTRRRAQAARDFRDARAVRRAC